MRGLESFHICKSAGSAAAPISCSVTHPRYRRAKFGERSASIAPSALLTSSFGTLYFEPVGARRKILPRNVASLLSPIACPPTPGSYQSATISDPSGAVHTSEGRNHLSPPIIIGTMLALYPAPSF